jgi:hypothetical protein
MKSNSWTIKDYIFFKNLFLQNFLGAMNTFVQ